MKINFSISRKINTAAYENIVISLGCEKEFELSDELEESSCYELIKTEVIRQFKIAEQQVLTELELQQKLAWQENSKKTHSDSSSSSSKKILSDQDLDGII